MNAEAFYQFYNNHLSENRNIRDTYIASLPYDKFIQPVSYSHGSTRNQVVNIMNTDEARSNSLPKNEILAPFMPIFDDRELHCTCWEGVEQNMCDYLAKIYDH